MYQPKVKNIIIYSNVHTVHEAKLLLLKNKKPPADVYVNNRGFHPIIISETEEIVNGDKFTDGESIFTCSKVNPRPQEGYTYSVWDENDKLWISGTIYKILALREHFSDKYLQDIADGKMKDGDRVLIRIKTDLEQYYENGVGGKECIYLNQQNHITLFVKQSLEDAMKDFFENNSPVSFDTQMRQYRYSDEQIERAIKYGVDWAKKNNC